MEISHPTQPRIVERKGTKALFEIENLYPGYGTTLGNSLRRVLLSSLPGAAVTLVKVRGVSHEFSTLPGVLEDIVDILLNIKKLRLRLHGTEAQVVVLKKKGEGKVTALDLIAPAQVEVIAKDVHIATLTDRKAELSLELTVEHGIGYSPIEARRRTKMEIGELAVDAIFTPIRNVNFTVENMRLGERTDYNRLLLEIETDGTVQPEESLRQAADILLAQFSAIASVPSGKGARAAKESGQPDVAKQKVSALDIPNRIIASLEAHGIKTVAGLARKRSGDIVGMAGIGQKALAEIKEALGKHGLSLKE